MFYRDAGSIDFIVDDNIPDKRTGVVAWGVNMIDV